MTDVKQILARKFGESLMGIETEIAGNYVVPSLNHVKIGYVYLEERMEYSEGMMSFFELPELAHLQTANEKWEKKQHNLSYKEFGQWVADNAEKLESNVLSFAIDVLNEIKP